MNELLAHGNQLIDATLEIGSHYRVIGRWNDAVQLYKSALLVDAEPEKQAEVKIVLSDILIKRAEYDRAENLLQEAQASLQNNDDLLSDILFFQGEIIYFRKMLLDDGGYDSSIERHKQALELRQSIGAKIKVSESMGRLGVLYERKQEHDIAAGWYHDAISLSGEIGDTSGKVRALTHLAFRKQAKGEMDEALSMFQEALDIAQAENQADSLIFNIGNLALHRYRMNQDFEQAIEGIQESYTIARKLDHKLASVIMAKRLGDIYSEHAEAEKSQRYYQEALEIAEQAQLPVLIQMVQNVLAST